MTNHTIKSNEQEVLLLTQINEKVNRLEYYQRLYMETMDPVRYSWFRMILEHDLEEHEVEAIYSLCFTLEEREKELKEAGLLDLTPLLLHFVGMLNPRLNPFLTAKALNEQGYYKNLTAKLIQLMS